MQRNFLIGLNASRLLWLIVAAPRKVRSDVVDTGMTGPFLATGEGRAMIAKITPTALAYRAYGEVSELAEAIASQPALEPR